jgi:hypothetical protein
VKSSRTLIAVAASVAVAALVIAGLFAVGSPATARKFKVDQRRVEHLVELHRVLLQHFVDQGELPGSLRALNGSVFEFYGGVDPQFDPETGRVFEYRRLSDRQYEVCARFHTLSDDPRSPNPVFREYRPPDDVVLIGSYLGHKPGRNCFHRTVTNSQLRDLYPEKFPIPGPVNVPQLTPSPPAPSITGNP